MTLQPAVAGERLPPFGTYSSGAFAEDSRRPLSRSELETPRSPANTVRPAVVRADRTEARDDRAQRDSEDE